MDARQIKGMEIAATTPIRRSSTGWLVPSQTGVGTYLVAKTSGLSDIGGPDFECSCPDYELRRLPCKHCIAVEMTIRREYNADGQIVAEEVRVTYSQNWPAYNAAQCIEKELFMPMLADLCSTIENAPQGRGRPRLPMSDMAFTAISRVYSGLSARRFDTDVREAADKGLTDQDAHFNSVLRYLRSEEMTPILRGLIELTAMPLKAVETDFAVDSTGFSTSRYERWYDHKWGKERSRQEWVKLHAMTGVRTNVVTAVEMSDGHSHDSPFFRPLLATTAESFDMREVSADKAYSSKANLEAVLDTGAQPFVPFKGVVALNSLPPKLGPVHSTWTRMMHQFAYQRDTFLTHYHKRSNVECTFSMIKRKFGSAVRSKSPVGQVNEVLCKVIAHNLCVIIASIYELGLEMPQFAVAG